MNVPDNNMLNDSEQAQILPARDVVPPAASPAPAQQVKNIMPGTGTDGIDHKINKETPAPAVLVSQPDAVSPAGDYIIGPGDTLSVSVWENSDLDKEVIVRPDGKISFPLIDDAVAAGLAIPQLRGVITAKLSEFIRYPQVVVSLRAIGGNKIIVLGEVGHPGVFSLSEQKSVLEAVALAGGFTKDAVLDSVIVIKGGLKNPQAMRVNLTKALIRANMKENVLLVSQDIVYVPRRFIANLSYFLNQILDPISKGASIYQQFQTLGVTTTTTVTQ
jgi:polysaccharide export outer membrane protein